MRDDERSTMNQAVAREARELIAILVTCVKKVKNRNSK